MVKDRYNHHSYTSDEFLDRTRSAQGQRDPVIGLAKHIASVFRISICDQISDSRRVPAGTSAETALFCRRAEQVATSERVASARSPCNMIDSDRGFSLDPLNHANAEDHVW